MTIIDALHHNLNVKVVQGAQEAIEKGYVYREPEYQPIRVDEVVVVKEGMESGKSSIDFVLTNAKGEKFVFILTENLLRSVYQIASA